MIVHPNKYRKINPALIQQVIGKGHAAGMPTPIGWWKVNEGSGYVFADSIAGNNLANVNENNPPQSWQFGPAEGLVAPYAVFSNGTQPMKTADSTVSVFNFNGRTPFTISLWTLINSPNSAEAAVIGNLGPGPTYTGWEIYLNGSGPQFVFALYADYSAGQGISVLMDTSQFPNSNNNHVCWTYDGSRTTAGNKVYVNGTLQTLAPGMASLTEDIVSTSPLLMGGRIDNSSLLGNAGAVEQDLRIYETVLTQVQVSALFTGGPA